MLWAKFFSRNISRIVDRHCDRAISLPTSYQQLRGVKTRWVKPKMKTPPAIPKFDYSGDNSLQLPELSSEETIFSSIGINPEEILEAQKEKYSILNADHKTQMQAIQAKVMEKFGRNELDKSSLEVRIATLTMKIRNQIRHMQEFPKDKELKRRLVENIQLRRKRLGELRQFDITRFDWLCKELNLTWEPWPMYNRYIPRRARMRQTAVEEMVEMKEKKLSELKASLDAEKEVYYSKKDEIMQKITKDQEELAEMASQLKAVRIQTGYPGSQGEIAYKLANLQPIDREKWWRKHPAVLKLKYGSRYRPPKP